MRSRRRTHHSHVAWSGSDEEFQAQTPQPAWDAAWGRVRAERKQAGLPNTYTGITAHLENGGTFEKAQQIVAHERRRPSFMTAPATKWTSVRSSGLGFESYRVTGESFGGPGRLKQDRHAGPLGCNGWFK